jgi:hypothetical protein
MDSQFNTLVRSYHDNYLDYKTTGKASYQTAYQSAQTGIDNILKTLQGQIDSQKAEVSSFYKSGVEMKLKELQHENTLLQHGLGEEQDQIVAAQMRSTPIQTFPGPSLTTYYIAGGVLAATIVLLMMV